MADTLRADHLDAYGYERETAPVLRRMASEGALFRDNISQASWTKVSTPSIHTSLYPTTHTVKQVADRLPTSANTLAEVYRAAGYATLSLSSVTFTGQSSNMHQGFEELHEAGSRTADNVTKSAREYVDRVLPWLEKHREVPFFVFLHVFDPHSPFAPRPPYDSLWADPATRAEFEEELDHVREFIDAGILRSQGMPSREQLLEAGVDPERFIGQYHDWYDGSIRGMDAEIGRLLEGLQGFGLADSTLVAFIGDHGEEFLEHGQTWHGHTLYGELVNVPLLLWWPGGVPAGQTVDEQIHWESAQESLQVPDCLSAGLGQRSRAFRANGLVGAFEAEGLEFQDICQQCESCRCGPQGLFHSWRRCRVARHDGHTMPSEGPEVKQNLERLRTSARYRRPDVTGRS